MRTEPITKVTSAPRRDRVAYWLDLLFGRTLPAVFFCVFLANQILVASGELTRLAHGHLAANDLFSALNRVLSLGYFTLLVGIYIVRLPAKRSDRRPLVVAVATIGTFSVLLTSFLPKNPHGPIAVIVADGVITLGLGFAIWGLAYLRRSFSIIPEARRLVTGGPYALSRNPLYFGEGLATIGIVLPVFGPWQAGLLLIFLACQALRIRWEERVLAAAFPAEYPAYRRRVPILIPFLPGGRD
ncbi:MAG: hypothetical protein NVS9B1_05280 [Candidatus Dormibacteraceae bacterium]